MQQALGDYQHCSLWCIPNNHIGLNYIAFLEVFMFNGLQLTHDWTWKRKRQGEQLDREEIKETK